MPRHIAFLRAINVGDNTVRMEVLRAHFEALGLAQVETFIASGNVIFEAQRGTPASLEKKIETALAEALGFRVDTFLRTPAEVAAIARCAVVEPSLRAEAVALNVGFLKAPLSRAALDVLRAMQTEIDDFRVDGREVYWVCRVKQSASKFSGGLFERKLGVRVTFRGINTLERLLVKHPPEA
jgi:uncharacterized protein (DUF1697 family)